MTEFSSLFDEFDAAPCPAEFVDVRRSPDWAAFIDAVDDANRSAVIYSGDDPTSEDVLERIGELSEPLTKLLERFKNMPCYALGLAYRADQESDGEEPVFVDRNDLRFYTPDMVFVAGQWRSVLRLYNARRTSTLNYGFHYMLPDENHLMDLRVEPRSDDEMDVDDAVELLGNYVAASRQFVTSTDFAELPAGEQRQLLGRFIDDLEESLPGELRDIDIPVQCSRYYIQYDDQDTEQGLGTYVDLRGKKGAKCHTLVGTMLDFEYPELESVAPDKQLTASDFTINGGAACMKLRNDSAGLTYIILPQTISEIA